MKVFVFKPSNRNIGKFTIDTFEDLDHTFRTFADAQDVAPFDYLECSGRNWTVMKGADGLELRVGRHRPTPQLALPESSVEVASSEPVSTSRYPALQSLSAIYRVLAAVTGIVALMIAIMGLVTIERGGVAFILGGLLGGIVGVVTNLAIAEGIKVLIDIEDNTRKTSICISGQNDRDTPLSRIG